MRLLRTHISLFLRPIQFGLFVVLASLLFAGCKPPEFVSSRYDNFTAYYNTFYNAREVFDKGYKTLTQAKTPIDRVRYLPIYERTAGTGSRDFDSAVLKSADLLRNHPDSKWVDDALLLIGKSYFYQENFVGSTQKFKEVIELNTSLVDEATFWHARSLITSGALDEAEKGILFALAKEDVNTKWSSQYSLLLAELKVKLSAWKEASDYLSSSIGQVKDKRIAARAQYLLGQVLEQQGRYEEAVKAYEDVDDLTPEYELHYAAGYSAVRVAGKHLNADDALAKLRKMERDDKNFSNLAELELLKAKIWQYIGRDTESFDIYDQLLYDPNALGNAVKLKGQIHYALGELYRDIDKDFVMAAAHFDTASASLETSTTARSRIRSSSYSATQIQYAPEAIIDANQLKVSFSRFSRVFKEIARYDSLLWLGEMPEAEFEAKVLEIRKLRAAELAEQRRVLDERQKLQSFQSGTVTFDPRSTAGLAPGKIVPGLNDTEGVVDGFLFHKSPVRIQEGRATFENTWGRRALAPNWRRSAAFSSSSASQAEDIQEELEGVDAVPEGELPTVSTAEVPRDSTSQATMRTSRANSRYELGNTLFLAMTLPDSAAVWYRIVIEEDSEQPVAQRALYALAEVQRALSDDESAERLYREILDKYPDSDFSDDVRDRLGLARIERAETDSTQLALQAYEGAYLFAVNSSATEAINRFLETAADWKDYDQSGQALMAAATTHLTWAGADSIKIYSALPVSVSGERMNKLWPLKFSWVERDSVLIQDDTLPMEILPSPGDVTVAPSVVEDENVLVPAMESETLSPSDSLAVNADSLTIDNNGVEALPDSVSVPPDSSKPDSSKPDSSKPDSLKPDSSKPDSVLVPSDSLGAVKSDSLNAGVQAEINVATQDVKDRIPVGPGQVGKAQVNTDQVEPKYEFIEAHEKRDSLYVEDIFVKIASEYRGKPLGLSAERTRKALVEKRTPPPDTTKVSPVKDLVTEGDPNVILTDSLGVPLPDSMQVASMMTLPSDSTFSPDKLYDLPSDSTEVLGAIMDSTGVRMDSTAVRQVPTAGTPGLAPAEVVANSAEEDYNAEEEGNSNATRTSSNLKPLLPTGRPNMDAVGWTVALSSHITKEAAQADFVRQSAKLDGAKIPIYLITNVEGEGLEFIVGWGLFATKELADEAIVKYDAFLPVRRNHLHLIPSTSRTP